MKRLILISLCFLLSGCSPALAQEINFNKLADAIYKAEGGAKTAHPYGILKKYKTTNPRQACLNTLRSKYKLWVASGRQKSYLQFLSERYAPIGASNDPKGLNQNWLKNVSFFLGRAS